MKILLVLYLITTVYQLEIAAFFNNFKKSQFTHHPLHDVGDPLILTPYLEENRTQEAREASEVHLDAFQNVTSYSGYFTVDSENNGSLFFWFFPSANDYTEDPVVLWLQGGPGTSSLFGLFAENGPFIVVDGNVSLRDISWHKNHSILYVDQPVGTGFSFTQGDYVTDQIQIAEHLYSFLTQFFTLFSEFRENEFYIAGESYAGKYIPAIGYAIHQNNPNATDKINLQGLLIGNGLSDPRHQLKYGDLLYQLGLIDLLQLDFFNNAENIMANNIDDGKYMVASIYWTQIKTFFEEFTGLTNIYNFLKDIDDTPKEWQNFVVQDEVREAIHVGSQAYDAENDSVYFELLDDITKSVAPWISELLSHYRVLIFNGQLDIIVAYSLTANYLQNLNFSAAAEYETASRQIWTVGQRVAGYVKTAGNLTEVLVRNAGHMIAMDQPEFTYNLISNFIRNVSIVIN